MFLERNPTVGVSHFDEFVIRITLLLMTFLLGGAMTLEDFFHHRVLHKNIIQSILKKSLKYIKNHQTCVRIKYALI